MSSDSSHQITQMLIELTDGNTDVVDRIYPHMRRRIEVQIELAKMNWGSLLAAYSVLNLFSPRFINEHEDLVQSFQTNVDFPDGWTRLAR